MLSISYLFENLKRKKKKDDIKEESNKFTVTDDLENKADIERDSDYSLDTIYQ